MPIANVTKIYSFSSEDPQWPAANLLTRTSKKWRCKLAGEQKAFVCFELDKPAMITGVDIGNEYSAYITVLVGRKGCKDEDFTELVLASSFMTAADCRNATNVNGVRCFHKAALIQSVATEKWELVKVVCTQPYNKQQQFGLSFVKFHIAADATDTTAPKPLVPDKFLATSATSAASPFAKFKMRADSSDSDSENASSLFNRWKLSKGKDTSGTAGMASAAAAIRDSATTSSVTPLASKPKFKPTTAASRSTSKGILSTTDEDENAGEQAKRVDRNRMSLMYDSDDEKPNEGLEKKLQRDIAEREKNKPSLKDKTTPKQTDAKELTRTEKRVSEKFQDFLSDDKPSKVNAPSTPPVAKPQKPATSDRFSPIASTSSSRKRSLLHDASSSADATQESPLKKPKASISKDTVYKPFGKLLEGVVLVISGIQNPERGHIRDKALRLGAKYKPDWDDNCTHLICAFKNTPKYNQVNGHGKIIRKDWIAACYDAKKRIPWRRYALDSSEKTKPESEDEIEDLARKPTTSTSNHLPKPAVVVAIVSESSDSESDQRYAEKGNYDEKPTINEILSSGSDTEDEIERVQRKNQHPPSKETTPIVAPMDDPYDQSTDDERPAPSVIVATAKQSPAAAADRPVTPLPSFFAGQKFYLSKNISSVDLIKLTNFIKVYGGTAITNANDAQYIVSTKPKQVPADFPGEVVLPLWVFECNELECLLPTERYRV